MMLANGIQSSENKLLKIIETMTQQSIFNEKSTKFYYLEYQFKANQSVEAIKSVINKVLKPIHNDVNIVLAFGMKAWNKLNPAWQPADLCSFQNLIGVDNYSMLSTQHDILFWIHSKNHDQNFDQVLAIQNSMQSIANLQLDLAGFNYHKNLDLIGFEDGTANPKNDDRQKTAVIPTGKIGAGGSYVLSQKWLHDLTAFNQLTIEQQEKIIGRTKLENIELEGEAMPVDSHISRTDVKVDGQSMEIYRRSDPYGNATEHGLYFLAFSCEMRRFHIQLERMLGITDDGIHDKLIEFSKAITSSYWFAPSQKDLQHMLK
jgi:putative iron-dependent peroxidase